MIVKNVTWEMVRNLANHLTSGLHTGLGVDISQAHMSDFKYGPIREFQKTIAHVEYRPCNCEPGCPDGWYAFDEEDVSFLRWVSLGSGAILEADRVGHGRWTLTFQPPMDNPDYQGRYWELFMEVENLENIYSPVPCHLEQRMAS